MTDREIFDLADSDWRSVLEKFNLKTKRESDKVHSLIKEERFVRTAALIGDKSTTGVDL